MAKSSEKPIGGRTSGLIGLNETVTWQAKHFGIRQKLTSKISAYERPYFFVDEMVKGAFRSIYHEHRFTQETEKTVMTDIFDFTSPLGIIGQFFNFLVRKNT